MHCLDVKEKELPFLKAENGESLLSRAITYDFGIARFVLIVSTTNSEKKNYLLEHGTKFKGRPLFQKSFNVELDHWHVILLDSYPFVPPTVTIARIGVDSASFSYRSICG